MNSQPVPHSVSSTTLADLLERVLDKGIVIAGDIKIKLVEVELLTIQIRLVVCSVDKAKELGLDWWNHSTWNSNALDSREDSRRLLPSPVEGFEERLVKLENELAQRRP
ncbi:MAG TPA: gas vesicle protein [Pseudomonadota bacterium]|nr:gas vesicle protein [Pseudomonadota bacterium]